MDTRSKRNLQLSYFDAFFSSLMIGAGEAFFAAYALSKGLGEVVAGLVIGLPMMMGAVVQTATPPLFGRFARTKTWVLIMSSMQALCLIALTFSSAIPQAGSFVIFVLIGLYWAFAFSAGTVWNYWMGYLVPEQECSSFFSFRLRLSQVGVVIGLLIAGFFLHHGEVSGWGAKAYFLPFFVAFISRCLSVYFLGGQSGVPIEKTVHKFSLNVRDFFSATARVFRDNPQARADLTFLFLFTVTLYISSNFVTPFLLVKRQFNYLSFMSCTMALYLGKIVSLSFAHKAISRLGVRRVLFIGALGMSPLPAVWLVVHRTWHGVLLQGTSGFFWGLYEVAVSLVLFNELPHRDKVQLLTWNNFFQTAAILIGTLIGGKILSAYDETVFGYFFLFGLGALLRTFFVLAHRPKTATNSR